jgi:hypothetical protein
LGAYAHGSRRWLAQLLAVLLLLQWGGFPTRALHLSALQLAIDTSICVADSGMSGHPVAPGRGRPWTDQICLMEHALDHTALLPPSEPVRAAIHWVAVAAPLLSPAEGPTAPRAPPLQPRAPPSLA